MPLNTHATWWSRPIWASTTRGHRASTSVCLHWQDRLFALTVGLCAGLLAVTGCGRPTAAEAGLRSDDRLIQLSTQLVAHLGGADERGVLRLILAEQADSVRDMASMTVAEFSAVHRRGPSDQSALIGTWYGRASRVLSGPGVAAQLDQAARESGINLTSGDPASTSKELDALTSYFNTQLPNEETDNPRNPNVSLLRSTFQSSCTAERQS